MKKYLYYFILLVILFGLFAYYKINSSGEFYNFCYGSDGCTKKLEATDAEVIDIFLKKYLVMPSDEPLNLGEPENLNPSMGQAQKIDEILKQKRDGFYIECGALDGEIRSNTLFFEVERNWKGLLIEPDPSSFKIMRTKNRHAYLSESCLAPSMHPISVKFQQNFNQGHILGKMYRADYLPPSEKIINVQCFPLLTYIKALSIKTVDYFSLDVEGAEFSILKEIPWDQVDIKTLSVEFLHDQEHDNVIADFMETKGYYIHSKVINPHNLAHDFIFVRKDVLS